MKRSGPTILQAAGLLLGGYLLAQLDRPNAPEKRSPSELPRRTEQVVIPVIDLHNASLEESVALLNKHAERGGLGSNLYALWRDGDPVPEGLRALSAAEAALMRTASQIPGLPPLPPTDPTENSPPITAVLTNIPLTEAARYVSSNMDCQILEAGGRWVVFHEYTLAPVLQRRDFFLLINENAHMYPHLAGTTIDLRPFLEGQAVRFPPGAYARHHVDDAKFEVCLAPEDMEMAEIIFSSGCEGIPMASSRWERIEYKASSYWHWATSYLPWVGHP